MKQYVFEVLEEMSKQRNRKDKVRVLKENESWALKDIIRGSMDTTAVSYTHLTLPTMLWV